MYKLWLTYTSYVCVSHIHIHAQVHTHTHTHKAKQNTHRGDGRRARELKPPSPIGPLLKTVTVF